MDCFWQNAVAGFDYGRFTQNAMVVSGKGATIRVADESSTRRVKGVNQHHVDRENLEHPRAAMDEATVHKTPVKRTAIGFHPSRGCAQHIPKLYDASLYYPAYVCHPIMCSVRSLSFSLSIPLYDSRDDNMGTRVSHTEPPQRFLLTELDKVRCALVAADRVRARKLPHFRAPFDSRAQGCWECFYFFRELNIQQFGSARHIKRGGGREEGGREGGREGARRKRSKRRAFRLSATRKPSKLGSFSRVMKY